jgi:hypothetical protein
VIYVEYISRRPGISLAEFHDAMNKGQEGWDADYAEDQLIWSAGRTWRLGPEPEYLGVWYTPNAGLERIDGWDRIFREGHAEVHEHRVRRAARLDAAGCYDALREPVRLRGGTYYAEFFRATGDRAAIGEHFEQRRAKHPGLTLGLLALRIGRLGPEPGGLAVWQIPDFAALAEIARELDGVREPIELVIAGTYADLGQEIL